jgi:uncharacterized delta-60 repeat protein
MKTYSILSLVFVFFFSNLAIAQFGTLDTSFDGDGKVLTEFQNYNSAVHSIAIQSDNKIIAAGSVYNHSNYSQLALSRYNVDGSLDETFGTAGKVVSNFEELQMDMTSIVIQPDGKILGGGIIYNNYVDSQFILTRYLPNGMPDISFGDDGKLLENSVIVKEILLQPDGKIVAAGFTLDPSPIRDLIVFRYNPDGTKDISFGTGGIVITSVGPKDFANAVALQPDGKIVIAGSVYTEYISDYLVARYLPNGTPDMTFGLNGVAVIDHSANDEISAIKIQPDGKLIFTGYSAGENESFSLVRLMPNGDLDPGFGSNSDGILCGPGALMGKRIELQPDGKIVIAGAHAQGGNYNISISRFENNGNLDETFGEDGVITTPFSTTCQANALLLQPDGKIVIGGEAGLTGGSYNPDFALARYISGTELAVNENAMAENTFAVYPNPVNESVSLDMNLSSEAVLSVDLYDVNGRMISHLLSQKDFGIGYNSQNLQLPDTLAKGMYVLNITNGNSVSNIRILK